MRSTKPKARQSLPALAVLIGAVLFCIFPALALATSAASSSASVYETGQRTTGDLICHTSNSDECYPAIFVPTDEFQTVREDQHLPSGLHVRMNIYTGLKEAKLYDPSEDTPENKAVLVTDENQVDAPHIPKDAPKYDPVGKAKQPKHESMSFLEGMKMLKSGVLVSEEGFDSSLEAMEDISHDMYYGEKIVEDKEVLRALFCLSMDSTSPTVQGVRPRDQQATAILSGSLSNNPASTDIVANQWQDLMDYKCPRDGIPLKKSFYSSLVGLEAQGNKTAASRAKAKVSLIHQLLRSPAINEHFRLYNGMSLILEVLLTEGEEWAVAQRKAGQLVMDVFLDEEMGAVTGLWPSKPKLSEKECKEGGTFAEGCWDYQIERIMKKNKGKRWDDAHWSEELHGMLKEARKRGPKEQPKHIEL